MQKVVKLSMKLNQSIRILKYEDFGTNLEMHGALVTVKNNHTIIREVQITACDVKFKRNFRY